MSGQLDNNYTGTGTHTLQNSTTNSTVLTLTTTGDNRVLTFQSDHIFSNGNLYLGHGSYRNLYRGSYHTFYAGTSNTEVMEIDANGRLYLTGSSTSYLEHTAAGAIKNTTSHGWTTIGAENGSYTCLLYTSPSPRD